MGVTGRGTNGAGGATGAGSLIVTLFLGLLWYGKGKGVEAVAIAPVACGTSG